MTIRKRSNGKYQIREMRNGITKCVTLGHKPTQREAKLLIDEQFTLKEVKGLNAFENDAKSYIDAKSNVMSPSTVRTYLSTLRFISEEFKGLPTERITSLDVQREVNRLALDHAPKTVRNYASFISGVLSVYRPDLKLSITLPQKEKQDVYIPTDEEVKAILTWVKAKRPECYTAFRMACYGLRRSEILAITPDDVKANVLTINKAVVKDANNEWVVKATKTTDSNRTVMVDNALAKAIKNGDLYKGHPNNLWRVLETAQDDLGITHFSFHKLRHYFVSKCIDSGIDIVTIRAWVGHASNRMIDEVYAHKMNTQDKAKRMIDVFSSDIL